MPKNSPWSFSENSSIPWLKFFTQVCGARGGEEYRTKDLWDLISEDAILMLKNYQMHVGGKESWMPLKYFNYQPIIVFQEKLYQMHATDHKSWK